MQVSASSSRFNWDKTLGALRRGNSVLFLGPLAYRYSPGQSLEEHIQKQLGVTSENHPQIRKFYPEDAFYLFHDGPARYQFILRLQELYQAEKTKQDTSHLFAPDSTLRQIARIPFRMIINLGAHDLLNTAFELEGSPYMYDFYPKGKQYRDEVKYARLAESTQKKPLIYNMLGDADPLNQESLLLTHKDLFEYLKSIFEGKSMAPELKGLLNKMENFIFLGMPFEKWYLQLLLQVLHSITEKAPALERFASYPNPLVQSKVLEQFNIHFIPDNPDVESFIRELHEQCGEDLLKGSGIAQADVQGFKQKLKGIETAFMKGKHEEALKSLMGILEESGDRLGDLRIELMSRMGTYNQLNELVVSGRANDTDRADRNKAVYSLLEGVSMIQKALIA